MKKGTSKFFSFLLVMVLLLNMTLVVNAASGSGSYADGTYSASLYKNGTYYVVSALSATAESPSDNPSVMLSGSAYSSQEGLTDSLYSSSTNYCSDQTYTATWSSASCNYYVEGSYVRALSI